MEAWGILIQAIFKMGMFLGFVAFIGCVAFTLLNHIVNEEIGK